jgi:sorting nexin-8
MKAASVRLRRERTPNVLGYTFAELCDIDYVKVELVPEKKGIILKHVEYEVTSRRFKSTVLRRYNDFIALHEIVIMRFPYRILPRLPPKKMLGGMQTCTQFLNKSSLFGKIEEISPCRCPQH